LKALHKASPVKITRLLTDKGKAFVDTMIVWDAKKHWISYGLSGAYESSA
jgi:hypothetical protein